MFITLLKILQIGERIKAPVDVNGNWAIIFQNANVFKAGCVAVSLPEENPEMYIEQSGKLLLLTFNDIHKTEMKGKLENDKMIFYEMLPLKQALFSNCGNETMVELVLNFQPGKKKINKLTGIFMSPGCSKCSEINFESIKKH